MAADADAGIVVPAAQEQDMVCAGAEPGRSCEGSSALEAMPLDTAVPVVDRLQLPPLEAPCCTHRVPEDTAATEAMDVPATRAAPAPLMSDEDALVAAALLLSELVTPALPAAEIGTIAAILESAIAVVDEAEQAQATLPVPVETDEAIEALSPPTQRRSPRVREVPKVNRPYVQPVRPKAQRLGEKAKGKNRPRRASVTPKAKARPARAIRRVVWLEPRRQTPAAAPPVTARHDPAPLTSRDVLQEAAEAVFAQFRAVVAHSAQAAATAA